MGSNGEDFDQLGEPVNEVLFFAGEHTHKNFVGCAHGAFASGVRAATQVLESLSSTQEK